MGKLHRLIIQIICLGLFISLLPLNVSSQDFLFKDEIYKSTIKTVQCYKNDGSPQTIINPAVTTLDQNSQINLEFDEIGDKANYYYAKLIHCNADWTKSSLADPEFMYEYNEFLIQDYDFSFNTKVFFTHYKFQVPKVKVSGNYILLVYSSEKEKKAIISRRIIIVENIIRIIPYFQVSEQVGRRASHQQVGFIVKYDQFEVLMPQNEIMATIRQNQRWDNAKMNLAPLYFDEGTKALDFRYFDESTNFPGWNEFRNFAFRNVNFKDANVQDLDLQNQKVIVNTIQSRFNKSYVNFIDINGNFKIENNIGDQQLASDYFNTTIGLRSLKLPGKLYVAGKLTDWNFDQRNLMTFDSTQNIYTSELLLKQGYYDYLIEYRGDDEETEKWFLEGSFYSAQNEYEIIIYFKPIGGRFDRIIGYMRRNFFAD